MVTELKKDVPSSVPDFLGRATHIGDRIVIHDTMNDLAEATVLGFQYGERLYGNGEVLKMKIQKTYNMNPSLVETPRKHFVKVN